MPKFDVRKTVRIGAPAERVYDTVRDFRQWRRWSPWLVAGPDAAVHVSDDGREYGWEGPVK